MKTFRCARIIVIYAVVGMFSVSVPAQNYGNSDFIKKENLLKTVTILASKEFDGRNPGTAGYEKAAGYMASEFQKIGLKPLGDSSYYQFFNVEGNEIVSPCIFNKTENGKTLKEYKLGKDFVCKGFTGSGKINAPVVFCGYGIYLPDAGYDDYKYVDVRNKIVMMFKQNPSWKLDSSAWPNAYERTKGLFAKQHRALGVLYVSLPNDQKPQQPIGSTLHGKGNQQEGMPQLHISIDVANELLASSGFTLSQLQTKIDSLKKPFSINANSSAELNINAIYQPEVRTENIIGFIEGSDSLLKNQYIVISAHLDHVGSQGGKIYFPGANDNASGSSAVLEMAKAFSLSNIKPKRSVIFVLFASEEQGLMGSEYCADHFPVPIDSVVAMFNLDCMGYGDSIQIGNGKSAPQLWNFIHTQDSLYFNKMVSRTWAGGGADLGAFHKKGIPGAYVVSTKSYEHLHQLSDTPETLNGVLFEEITKLTFISAYKIAQGEYVREKINLE